ncbi:hypothetical protein CBR_g48349 [Chara braunii]|uniref:Uncharacterized protein n=1 Tax=Chara braunii TaxID=69332 RepID=A0A388K4A9_CHABU|nr:hypothetical protein CBR_g48349 [Chara braunii]|eukprot:GBG64881.1 hypothetical protein CBR_g48349 [Chara braunii]
MGSCDRRGLVGTLGFVFAIKCEELEKFGVLETPSELFFVPSPPYFHRVMLSGHPSSMECFECGPIIDCASFKVCVIGMIRVNGNRIIEQWYSDSLSLRKSLAVAGG